MNNRERPQYIREILERDNEVDPLDWGRMFKYYVIAAAIGTALLFTPLIARGCYHKISERYNASQNEPKRQEKPVSIARN